MQKFVRELLNLPRDVPSSAFYTPVKCGEMEALVSGMDGPPDGSEAAFYLCRQNSSFALCSMPADR